MEQVIPPTDQATPLWQHQAEYVERDWAKADWALLWEPRLGKTLATLRGIARWHFEQGLQRVLIVAPKTVCANVWSPMARAELGDIEQGPPEHRAEAPQVVELYDGALSLRKGVILGLRQSPGFQVVLVNYDALDKLADSLLRWKPQAVIFDEGHAVKTPSARRSLAAYRIARVCHYRRVLTGTVAPNGLIDLYGIWKVLSPTIFGTNKAAFCARYCNMDAIYPNRVLSYRNVSELRTKAFEIADIRQRKDCFDIPPLFEVERLIEMPYSARVVYDKIVSDHVLELKRADHVDKIPMTHTFSRLTQLAEVAIGYARHGDTDSRQAEWLHSAMIDATEAEVRDIVESGQKVVVFHYYRPEGAKFAAAIKDLHPLQLHGDILNDERKRAIERFHSDDNYQVIICQEQVASLGISLAAGNYAVFLSMSHKWDNHKQASDRIFKPQNEAGDVKTTLIYPLVKDTVLPGILKRLRAKASVEKFLLEGNRAMQFAALAHGD